MSDTITPRLRIKAQPEVSVRAKAVPVPKVRLRVMPSLLPLQIELRNTGSMVQWRYVGGDWQDLIPVSDLDTTITIGTVTTLPPGADATVVNVGTPQDMVLNFGIPRGQDRLVTAIIAGAGISVDATDPTAPIISAPPPVASKTTPVGADVLIGLDSEAANAPKRFSFTNLQEWIRTKLGAMVSASGAKSTPVDADQLLLSDSAASNGPAKLSWLNLKATLKTYLDTLYPAIAAALFNNVEDQVLTGGARVTVKNLGNLSGASITPDPGDRPIQKITNNGAGSILPGSNEGQYTLQVINTTGAGAVTTTGWTLKGDSFDATTTSKFACSCLVTSDIKLMTIVKVV